MPKGRNFLLVNLIDTQPQSLSKWTGLESATRPQVSGKIPQNDCLKKFDQHHKKTWGLAASLYLAKGGR